MKVDRRIQRTKKLLSDALMDLILEKGYEAVTVQDIIDRANVGRSTFYAHFENKDQLLFGSHQELTQLLFSVNEHDHAQPIDFLSLYRHAKAHDHVAKAMLGKKGGDLIIGHFQDAIVYKILNEEKKYNLLPEQESKMLSFLAEATSAALVRLLTCWLDNDLPFSEEEMAEKSKEIYSFLMKKTETQ